MVNIINGRITAIADGVDGTDGVAMEQIGGFSVPNINLNVTGPILILSPRSGVLFIPQTDAKPFGRIRAISGSPGVPVFPQFRVGNNGSYNNLLSSSTLTAMSTLNGLISGSLFSLPTQAAIDIGTTGISLDVQTASNYTTYAIDLFFPGFFVS